MGEIKSSKAHAEDFAQAIAERAQTLSGAMNSMGAVQKKAPEDSMLEAYGKMNVLISRLGTELAADATRINSIADVMEIQDEQLAAGMGT